MLEHFRRTVRVALGLNPSDDLPVIDRLAFYRAEVRVAASDGSTVDVQPEDKRIPAHQKIPLRVGIPGTVAVVQPGAIVMIGWERGDPSKPYAVPAWEAGASVTKLTINASTLEVKGSNVTVEATGTAKVKGATVVIGDSASEVKLGLVGALPVLVQGTFDSLGVPVTNNPAASATIVKAG